MSVGTLIKTAIGNHKGTGHNVAHSITTLLNVPLFAWFICAVTSLHDADHAQFAEFFSQPVHMVFAVLFVLNALAHFVMELEVVLEDYVSDLAARKGAIQSLKLFALVLGVFTIISIVKLQF